MPSVWRKTGGSWVKIKTVYRKTGGSWQSVRRIWRKTAGAWQLVFQQSITPDIDTQVEITLSTANGTTQTKKLTGKLYHWTNATGVTYNFAKGSGDNLPATFTNISGASGTSTNPASGSSNTSDTYTLSQSDMIQNATNWFIYISKATNSTYGTEQTSASYPVTFDMPRDINTLAVGTVTKNSIDLSWTATTGSGSYAIYYGTATSPTTLFTTTTLNSITVTGLTSGTKYYFRILPWTGSAGNGYYGNYSNEVFDTTKVAPGDVTSLENYNFDGTMQQGFFTTGSNTTRVDYYFNCLSIPSLSVPTYTQYTSSYTPYKIQQNLLSYFTYKAWNYDTYSSLTSYFGGNTVWYAGNQYQARTISWGPASPQGIAAQTPSTAGNTTYWTRGAVAGIYPYTTITYSSSNTYTDGSSVTYGTGALNSNVYYYTGNNVSFSNINPTTTSYWDKIQTVTYNVGDYLYYNTSYYFCKSSTSGTYPTNTLYWASDPLAFTLYATPYNGTVPGNLSSAGTTLTLRADGSYTDPLRISSGPTFSSITSSGFTTTFLPSIYTNQVDFYIQKTSNSTYPTGYNPKVLSVSGATSTNHTTTTALSPSSQYLVTINSRYLYNSLYSVYHNGSGASDYVTTLSIAPDNFSFTLSDTGTVTTPPTPSITRVSSTSNYVLFELNSSFPSDTYQYGVKQSGAAFGTRAGDPAQTVTVLNQWDSNANFVTSGGTYDAISTIEPGSSSSEMTIATRAYGKTRSASANVSSTTNALSWAINFSWSGASSSSVTYFSNGSGTLSSSTAATVTVYTNSMPVKIVEVTGSADPTITINNITAYAAINQTGSNTAGTAGTTTSFTLNRPQVLSSSTTQYYSYYTAPSQYTISYFGNTADGGSTSSTVGTLPLTVSSNGFTKTGHTFSSWNTLANGTGTSYAAGASYNTAANLNLYAQWTPDTYTVSYNKNTTDTVSNMPSSQTKTYGVALTLSSNTPTRSGFTFGGWNTASDGTGTSYAASGSYTTNAGATLYAQWTSSGPTAPTALSVTTGTVTANLSTTLTRNSNTNKTQAWTTSTSQGATISWTKGTGSGTITSDVKWNQTGTTPAASDTGTWTGVSGSSQVDGGNSGGTTNYYWVRTVDGNGNKSAWVSAGSYTATSPSMTGFTIRIYRGNGSSFSNPTTAPSPTSTSGSYTWTGLTDRGNPSTGGEGHYAWANGTLNGTVKTTTSSTV